MADNAAQIAYWNGVPGQRWVDEQARIDFAMRGLSDAALAAASVRSGERVLDLGCGSGSTTLELARQVGARGRVIAVDVSRPLLEQARQRATHGGIGNVDFVLADASTHDFSGTNCDVLFSRLGAMFFADPVGAFVNLRRALKPGARLLLMAWRSMADNDWAAIPYAAVAKLLPPIPPAPKDAPGIYAFADPERVRRILEDAGYAQVRLTPLDGEMAVSGTGLEDAVRFQTMLGPVARVLNDLPPPIHAKALEAIAEALRPHVRENGVRMAAACWLVSARSD